MEDLKYQLVLQLPGNTRQDFEELATLEELVMVALQDTPHEVDGHDFGSGTMNVFIDTNEPVAAFALVKDTINIVEYPMLKAAYRSFADEDYKLIWPENSDDAFDLM